MNKKTQYVEVIKDMTAQEFNNMVTDVIGSEYDYDTQSYKPDGERHVIRIDPNTANTRYIVFQYYLGEFIVFAEYLKPKYQLHYGFDLNNSHGEYDSITPEVIQDAITNYPFN